MEELQRLNKDDLLLIYRNLDKFSKNWPQFGPQMKVSALLTSDIVPSCKFVQYQGKLMIQLWENDKNPDLGPILGVQKFFPRISSLLIVRQCS